AREAKYRPMCVAVLDDGGCLKALKREDGASILRPNIAVGKAWGAVGMGESSRALSERLKERPAFLGALSDMSGGKVVPVAGGVLIMALAPWRPKGVSGAYINLDGSRISAIRALYERECACHAA